MENLNSFIQILLWIVLPVLFIAVIVTVVLHYWRKRKAAKEAPEEILEADAIDFKHVPAVEPVINVKKIEKINVKPEKNNVKQEKINIKPETKEGTMSYNDEIEKNREIIAHLKTEFSFLEKKYQDLKAAKNDKSAAVVPTEDTAAINEMLKHSESKVTILNTEIEQVKNKNNEYSRSIEALKDEIKALQKSQNNNFNAEASKAVELETKLKESELQLVILQEEMNGKLAIKANDFLQLQTEKEKLLAETKLEKEKLLAEAKLEKEKLLTEAKELKEQLNFHVNNNVAQQNTSNDERYQNLLQENESLKNKVADYSYFDDLVNEKKQQISFLENQIEQRVRQVHDTEQNFYSELKKVEMYGSQIASLKTEYDDISSKLAGQIKIHDSQLLELDRLKKEAQQKTVIITEKQQVISELENNFKAEKESSLELQQTINADKATILQLTVQTEDQLRKIDDLEGKLKISSQLLARIYTDLGKSFASIFSDDINILPENSKLKELSKNFTDASNEVHHPEEFA
jgi:chromosome segregation ATPase